MTRRASATLTYHLVAGKVISTDMTEALMGKTVNGGDVTIALDGGAKVSGAVISTAGIAASNGVVHVIDAGIMPPMQSDIFCQTNVRLGGGGLFHRRAATRSGHESGVPFTGNVSSRDVFPLQRPQIGSRRAIPVVQPERSEIDFLHPPAGLAVSPVFAPLIVSDEPFCIVLPLAKDAPD